MTRVTGLPRQVLADLAAQLGPCWQAREGARLADRPRQWATSAGARDRLIAVCRTGQGRGESMTLPRAAAVADRPVKPFG